MKYIYFVSIILILMGCSDKSSKASNLPRKIESNRLPYIGHVDVMEYEENGVKKTDTLFETVSDFDFLNEDSVWVSNNTFQNKVWIAEFFFASCPTICPLMNGQMSELYSWLQKNKYLDYFQLLSFSIDPLNDTPSALKTFKKSYCEDCSRWSFLTGEEKETHRLGIESFKIFSGRDEAAEGGYAHSGAFSLVDRKERVRGVYNITDENGDLNKKEFDRLKKDIVKLMRHEYNIKEP